MLISPTSTTKGQGGQTSESPAPPLDGNASGLTRHALKRRHGDRPTETNRSSERASERPVERLADEGVTGGAKKKSRPSRHLYSEQVFNKHPLDVTTFSEPSNPVLLELLHRFLDANHPRSSQRVNATLEELQLAYANIPRQVIAGPGNQAIRSSHSTLPYHIIRLEKIIGRASRREILGVFRRFDSYGPGKHVPKTNSRTTHDSDNHFHPYHFAIIKRQSNTLGTTKDTLQSARKALHTPTSLELRRRQAAYHLTNTLDRLVATPIRRYYAKLDPTTTDYAFHVGHFANIAADANNTQPLNQQLRFGGLASGVAFGYGEARKPHLDTNDSPGIPSLIVQLDGPPAFTRFPQLNLDVKLCAGDAIIAPTRSLIHHGLGAGSVTEERVTAVFYTCRHMENLVGKSLDGTITEGVFAGLADHDIHILDE